MSPFTTFEPDWMLHALRQYVAMESQDLRLIIQAECIPLASDLLIEPWRLCRRHRPREKQNGWRRRDDERGGK
jgi:hypothetical protein